MHYELTSAGGMVLQRGAYVASSPSRGGQRQMGRLKGFLSEGLVLLKATGEGDLFFNTYGAIVEVDIDGDYYVDNNNVVAFEDTLDYNVTVLPGLKTGSKLKSFLFGGEGLVSRFEGRGKLWIQTRCVAPFLNWVYPYRPVQSSD